MTFYQPNKEKKLFQPNSKKYGLIFLLLISMVSMIIDDHFLYLKNLRHGFSYFVAPLQFIVDYPGRVLENIRFIVSTKKSLLKENIHLRYQQSILEARLQKLLAIKEENFKLRELLMASPSENLQTMAAEILAVETSSTRQSVILNKGSKDKVYIGQPVLDAKGVMGQIIDVGYMTSTVLLISDAKSAVPVKNNRTGEYAILIGKNNAYKMALINLPKTSAIKKNDVLVTSGLGRLYPEGYPVGYVHNIKSTPGDAFIKVDVHPFAALNKNRLVLLIWPSKEHIKLSLQIQERLAALKSLG